MHDAAGAVVPGVTINLRATATNQSRRVVSEADGSFRAPALPVGTYEVRAEAVGFKPYANAGVTPEQFKEMLRYVKTNKRKAAADLLASYAEGTTEQP